MRRGFKTWSETISLHYRKELGIGAAAPLKPLTLAAHLGVLVWRPEDIPGLSPSAADRLLLKDPESWSAVTLRMDDVDLIIVNSAHSPARQASSVMHEVAHVILKHEPARVDVSEMGHMLLSSFDREQEAEADWLGGALLLPRPALLEIANERLDNAVAARRFGVSLDLLAWRRRMTGVDVQMSRRAGWR